MSKRHTISLYHVITVDNDKLFHVDGIMQGLADKKTQWKEDLYFAIRLARQKLSNYYAEVTPQTGMLLTSAYIVNCSGSCNCVKSGIREWI